MLFFNKFLSTPYSHHESQYGFNITVKLFIKFLKYYHLVNKVYPMKRWISTSQKRWIDASQTQHAFFRETIGCDIRDGLVYSQLWRIWILKNIDMYPKHLRNDIKFKTIDHLIRNGSRGNEKVATAIKRYKILNGFNKVF